MVNVLSIKEVSEELQKIEGENRESSLYVGIPVGVRTLIVPIVSVEHKSFPEVGGSYDTIHREALVTIDLKRLELHKLEDLRNLLDTILKVKREVSGASE